jgi:hypothetical protein
MKLRTTFTEVGSGTSLIPWTLTSLKRIPFSLKMSKKLDFLISEVTLARFESDIVRFRSAQNLVQD